MKRQTIIAALFLGTSLFGIHDLQAQGAQQATTAVNIVLADVLSIDQGSAASGGAVDFSYSNPGDYSSAKNVTVPNSLVIISSKNFDVKVKSDGANFVSGANLIPVDVLKIEAAPSGNLSGTLKEVTLSAIDQVLVSNASLGSTQSLNINYSISAEKASQILLGKPKGTYIQKVTYTATAL